MAEPSTLSLLLLAVPVLQYRLRNRAEKQQAGDNQPDSSPAAQTPKSQG